nr:DNA-directed DNA polymerase [Tanacetum cinerariifolium]
MVWSSPDRSGLGRSLVRSSLTSHNLRVFGKTRPDRRPNWSKTPDRGPDQNTFGLVGPVWSSLSVTNSSTPAISSDVAELKDMVKTLLLDKKNQSPAPTVSTTPAPVKAVKPNCVTCGGAHSYQNCPATHENAYRDNIQEGNNFNQNRGGNFNQSNFNPSSFNQGQLHQPQVNQAPVYQAPIPQTQRVSQTDFESYVKANDAILRNMQSQVASVSALMPNLKPSIPYPSRCDNEKCHDQANEQIKKFYKIFKEMSFEISFMDALILMPKFASALKALIGNKEKLSEMARTTMNEHCLAVILNKLPRKLVWEGLSLPELTPTCMTLKLADRSVSKPIGIAKDVSFKVGVFHFPANFVVVDFEPDPRVSLILESRCFFGLEDDPDSPKINPFYYDSEGDILLLEAILNSEPSPPLPNQEQNLPSFKEELRAYEAQTVKSSVDEPPEVELEDLPHHLEYEFLEGDNKLPVIIAKELGSEEKFALIKVLKSHNLVHCVPKKGGFTVVENEENELIPTRLVTEWRVCIDYRKFEATREDHFPLPFMDQMLERLAGNEYYCFLDGFSGCMLAIFHDMVEKTMEVFMDDFSVFGNSFENCLSRLDKMLQRCEDTNLSLNWEKSHFMVKKGIVLGHKISKNRIVVDRAKVNVIAKLPHPTTVKAYWALKQANFDPTAVGDHQKIQLNELNEIRDQAYENSLIYKEKTKKIHDSKIKNRFFIVGDRVLLFNLRLKIFSGKLKTSWSGPFTIAKVFPYGTVELSQANRPSFKVNDHRIKTTLEETYHNW